MSEYRRIRYKSIHGEPGPWGEILGDVRAAGEPAWFIRWPDLSWCLLYKDAIKSGNYEFEDPQPSPVANDNPSAHDKVMADIAERKAHGIRKYGTMLQPQNGRSSLEDAYAEALDLTAYLANELMERELKGDDVPQ